MWRRFALFARPVSCRNCVFPREKEHAVFFFHSHTRRAIKAPKYFPQFPARIPPGNSAFNNSVLFQDFVRFSFVRSHTSSCVLFGSLIPNQHIYKRPFCQIKNFLRGKFSCIICTQSLWKFLHKHLDGLERFSLFLRTLLSRIIKK